MKSFSSTIWQALDASVLTRGFVAGKTDLTALVRQVHVRELLELQGDWHRPCSLTQTTIQMMNGVWNLNSKLCCNWIRQN